MKPGGLPITANHQCTLNVFIHLFKVTIRFIESCYYSQVCLNLIYYLVFYILESADGLSVRRLVKLCILNSSHRF